MSRKKCVCGDCEYSFETLPTCYICDVDAEPIQLDTIRIDCPFNRRIVMWEVA